MFIYHILLNLFFVASGGFSIKFGIDNINFYTKIKNLSTSKIKSLAAGDVEIKGRILEDNQNPLISPLNKAKCVSYCSRIYRLESSGSNNNGFSTNSRNNRRDERWTLVYQETSSRAFYLADDTGFILVNPEGAKIRNDNYSNIKTRNLPDDISNILNQKMESSKSPKILKKLSKFSNSNSEFKLEETYIPENEDVYIMGYTTENPYENNNPNIQRLMISKKDKKDFVITDEKEEDLQKTYSLYSKILIILGLFLIFWGLIQFFNIIDWINFIGDFNV